MNGHHNTSESRRRLSRLVCSASLFLLTLTMVSERLPAVTPRGDEFKVNTHTWAREPSLGIDDNGAFVVVWHQSEVIARRFDSTGSPLSENFSLSEGINSEHFYDASVDMEGNGEFVVSFTKGSNYPSYPAVIAALYPPETDGTAVARKWINVPGPADAAISAQGNFVVAWGWHSYYYQGVEAGRWDRALQPISGGIPVASTDADPVVAMNSIGEFVVVWEADDGSAEGIMARSYDATDAPRGAAFQVNQETLGGQTQPDVAIDDEGRFLVTWTSPDSHGTGVFARRFDRLGSPITDEFRLNTEITGNQAESSAAMNSRGAFVVAWQSNIQDDSGYGVFLQAFRDNGDRDPESPVETLVNQTTADNQYLVSLDLSDSGVIGVAWQDESESNDRVMARLFFAAVLAPKIFSDGFESGNTSAWTATAN